ELQTAALRAIGQISQDRAAKLLLAARPSASPALRPRMLETLMARAAWVELLLTAIEKQKVAAGEIPPVFRERLLKHIDPQVRTRAASALATTQPAERAKVTQQFQSVLKLQGNPANGSAVFARACSACHQLNGVGAVVGPNLAALTDRST